MERPKDGGSAGLEEGKRQRGGKGSAMING